MFPGKDKLVNKDIITAPLRPTGLLLFFINL